MDEFSNIITMDAENIKRFKKLYGDGRRLADTPETLLSFSMIIPEPSRDDADSGWADNTNQDVWAWRKMNAPGGNTAPVDVIGNAIKTWRMDNWGTTSDVLYDGNEEPFIRTLDGLLKGEFPFYTFGKPPIKVYEKMAADGLVFETRWWCDFAYDEWFTGKGKVEDGRFQYHAGPMTGSENLQMQLIAHDFLDCSEEDTDDQKTIVVKNREHLDQLLKELQRYIETNLYMQGTFGLIDSIAENTIALNKVLDLNFLDVSNVTDFSNLFANFDVSPEPSKGWFCKIKLDISKWNISNVSKKALLLDNDRVDLGDLSK